jgi:type II secretory pathway pseudopilin PulG
VATLILGLLLIAVLTVLALAVSSWRFRRQRAHEEALAKRAAEEAVNLAVDRVRGEPWRRQASS